MQVKLRSIQTSVVVINILLLLVLYSFSLNILKMVNIVNTILFIPICCSIYFCYKIYKNIHFKNNSILIYLITAFISSNSILWYLVMNVFKQKEIQIFLSITDVSIYCLACICIIYFIINNTKSIINIFKNHYILTLLSILLTFCLNGSFVFCLLKISNNGLFVLFASITILLSMCALEIILLGLIFCKNLAIEYILLGFLLTINCIFVETSSTQQIIFYYLGQISWYFGMWIFSIGLYGLTQINTNKNNHHNKYFNFFEGRIRNLLIIRTLILSLTSAALIYEILLFSHTISFRGFLLVPSGIIIFSLVMLTVLDNMFNDVQKDFNNILNLISNVSNETSISDSNFSILEFKTIKEFVINSFASINDINEKHNQLEKINHLNELKIIHENNRYKELLIKKNVIETLAAKDKDFINNISLLVHDIKSPTTLIHNIIEQNSNILNPLDSKALELANKRILFLTQNLLKSYKHADDLNHNVYFNIFLAIDNSITEFRSAYKNIIFEFNYTLNECFYLLQGNLNMFERMLTNLIDNAVNTLSNISDAKIVIDLLILDDFIEINITDNGPGIPEEIKQSFFAKTEIKSTKPNGNGIGLRQVSETLDMFSASCKIDSFMGNGTIFNLKFPQFNQPHWICERIILTENQEIIIFDDDINIHQLWDNRFAKYINKNQVKVTHFQDVATFQQFISRLTNLDKQNILFLCDYDIRNDSFNGLDLIKTLQVQNSILATGHFEEYTLQEELDKLSIKMLDKRMISYIQIEFEKKQKHADMVWLDDQEFFPKYIANKFYPHLKIDIYSNVYNFLQDIIMYKLDTIIILDFNLNSISKMNGISIAQKLHEMGFTHLIILTADTVYLNDIPDYVKLINKSDHAIANLESFFNS